MDELLKLLLGLSLFFMLGLLVWESTKMVDDKNRRNK